MDSSSSESGDERPDDQFTEIDEKTGKDSKKDGKLVKYKLMVDDKSVTLIAETGRDSDDGYFDGSCSSGCSSDDDDENYDSGLDVADDRNDGPPRRANILGYNPKNPNYSLDISEELAAVVVSRINATIDNDNDDDADDDTTSSSSSSDSEDDRSSMGSSDPEECWEDGYENANIDDETASNCDTEISSSWDAEEREAAVSDDEDDRNSSTSDVIVDGEFPDEDQWNLSSDETADEIAAVETATVTVVAAAAIGSPERSLFGNRLPRRPTPNWDLVAATAEEPSPEFARVRETAQKNLNAKIAELEKRKHR